MRPTTVLVFGNLEDWLQHNGTRIGRQTLAIEVIEPPLPKKQCIIAPAPPTSETLLSNRMANDLKMETQPTIVASKSKTSFHVSTKPKAPIGTPTIVIPPAKKTESKNGGVFTNWQDWTALRRVPLCNEPLPLNALPAPSTNIAVFNNHVIKQLTRMYVLKLLPDGSAVGDAIICKRLEGRESRFVPPFLPTKLASFGQKAFEIESVKAQFERLWFRVHYANYHDDEIVHFKDLYSSNTSQALKPLLNVLFMHLANDNQKLKKLMEFALDVVLIV